MAIYLGCFYFYQLLVGCLLIPLGYITAVTEFDDFLYLPSFLDGAFCLSLSNLVMISGIIPHTTTRIYNDGCCFWGLGLVALATIHFFFFSWHMTFTDKNNWQLISLWNAIGNHIAFIYHLSLGCMCMSHNIM